MTIEVIEHVEVTAASVSNIVFSSIPQTYTDLLLMFSIRTNRNSANAFVGVRPNGLTTNQNIRKLENSGTTLFNGNETSIYGFATGNTSTASGFGSARLYFKEYASAKKKAVYIDAAWVSNATNTGQHFITGLWDSTSAITSLTLLDITGGTALLQYSSATLYGITS